VKNNNHSGPAKAGKTLHFIDVFAGCGGLSLGLMQAGCQGVFAIEKSPLAFSTLKHNLIENKSCSFKWPEWLPQKAMTCEELIADYESNLGLLAGHIDLIVGGPPCQGFSTAGKRDPSDPRNKMTEQYLSLVGLVKPRFIVIENVAGYDMKFENEDAAKKLVGKDKNKSYAQYISERLKNLGYAVSPGLVNCADFGVPQNRQRFLLLCERCEASSLPPPNLFRQLKKSRRKFLEKKSLPTRRKVGSQEAISDLEVFGKHLIPSTDFSQRGFFEIEYREPKKPTAYQSLMRIGCGDLAPNSKRIVNHKPSTIKHFRTVQANCRPGFCLSVDERAKLGLRKHSITVLHPKLPAPTITTLPDDVLHYSEPRILTARESARLQSFPDWFAFQGKYTTGGKQRKQECPRYTQIGNAVPPLLSEAIGKVLLERLKSVLASAAAEPKNGSEIPA
jgi:DNA (cytosine-5)-methyltransferase 1